MNFAVMYEDKLFFVEFKKLRRTERRAKWFPITAVSATQALVREAEDSDDLACTACGIGLSFRYKKDTGDQEIGQRYALGRALQRFDDKAFRRRVWENYHYHFPISARRGK
jgi:hypothetical protein